jgi:3-methyladenine DNA glycosylase AlkD
MAVKTKPAVATKSKPASKSAPVRLSLAETMAALEKAGSAQTRKTYARHGATGPMFGVSFADIKTLVKRIKVDHELALALWDTGNLDARTLAVKIADPQRMSPKDLDRWAGEETARMYPGYVSLLAAEGPHGKSRAEAWLASDSENRRCSGWFLVGALASNDEAISKDWFADRIATLARSIHKAPNEERKAMNRVLIAIGGRDESARKEALAAAKRIGEVIVDHGDTQCETPDAAQYIDKAWSFAASKGFSSPAAQERSRESMRTRC